jgi:hypothetical protein
MQAVAARVSRTLPQPARVSSADVTFRFEAAPAHFFAILAALVFAYLVLVEEVARLFCGHVARLQG